MSNTEIKLIAASTALLVTSTLADVKKQTLDICKSVLGPEHAQSFILAAEVVNLKEAIEIHMAEIERLKKQIG